MATEELDKPLCSIIVVPSVLRGPEATALPASTTTSTSSASNGPHLAAVVAAAKDGAHVGSQQS
jgi:hypothetical protein